MKRIHGGDVWEVVKRYELLPDQILDFSANISPLGPSPKVLELIRTNSDQVSKYPGPWARPLVGEIARYCGVESGEVIATNGSTQLIYLVVRAFRPKRILVPQPTFCEYEYSARMVGAEVKFLNTHPKNGFGLEVDKVLEQLRETDMFFLCNPNNPTGAILFREEVLNIIQKASELGVYVVIDEAFMDFLKQQSVLKEATQKENVIVLRSLTKFFGLPGLRLGYGVSNKKMINRLLEFQEPWSVNCFAQLAGIEALKDRKHIAETYDFTIKERDFLFSQLSSIKGLKVYASWTNFLLVEIKKDFPLPPSPQGREGKPACQTGRGEGVGSSTQLWEALAKKGILIRDCSSFPPLDNRFVRVAVRSREKNLRLLEAMRKVIDSVTVIGEVNKKYLR